MQILHPFAGSIQQYDEQLADPDRYRPAACPLCRVPEPLASHGFYQRTVVDETVDGLLRVRRYLCRCCWRTVSLLPEFLLPYVRFSVSVVARFLTARVGEGQTLKAAAQAAGQPHMPYQRGQHWVRRFRQQAPGLSVALAAVTTPRPAADWVSKALGMLKAVGWIAAHRFLFSQVRGHLLGWPRFLAPDGLGGKLSAAPRRVLDHTPFVLRGKGFLRRLAVERRNPPMVDAKSEKIALFRYGLIAPLVLEKLPRGELRRRARELAARHYEIPASDRTTLSLDTLLLWVRRYQQQGFAGLAPRPRCDRGRTRVLTPELAQQIERLKRENPHRNGVLLLQELARAAGQSSPPLSASTLYRFLKQRGLQDPQQLMPAVDRKKFEAELANQIWQSDLLFGPYVERPGGGKRPAFLYAILDDASRLVPHAQFYAHQGLEGLLDCLRQALAARGLPLRLYVDNGRVYHSQQLARIAASLGILLVHTPPYQPQGRGKIERFFRSLREQFLASLDPQPLLSLEQLNQRLAAWIENVYHRSVHSALGTTPLLRWQRDIEQIRQLPPATDLRRLFFYRLLRLVRRDATFLLGNRFYEAPAHLVGQRVEVRFDPLDPAEVDLYGNGQPEGRARPVDVRVNAQLPRSRAALADPPNRKE